MSLRGFHHDELEAVQLGARTPWLVRPKGALGTIGWHPNPWEAELWYVDSAEEAIERAVAHNATPTGRIKCDHKPELHELPRSDAS